jgi:hypothetical protein
MEFIFLAGPTCPSQEHVDGFGGIGLRNLYRFAGIFQILIQQHLARPLSNRANIREFTDPATHIYIYIDDVSVYSALCA